MATRQAWTRARSPTFWLPERRRSIFGAVIGVAATFVLDLFGWSSTLFDDFVVIFLAYLDAYLATTIYAFAASSRHAIAQWAERESRGTFWQRYVVGSAPGPGVSLSIAIGALLIAVLWLPQGSLSSLPHGVRILLTCVLVASSWACVVVSFAVAFHADDLVEQHRALDFPNTTDPGWSDYVYFAVALMSTFGTTDVTVSSAHMRRTVTANSVIAFFFNTFTVATVVSGLVSL